jgi:hypothetical protein
MRQAYHQKYLLEKGGQPMRKAYLMCRKTPMVQQSGTQQSGTPAMAATLLLAIILADVKNRRQGQPAPLPRFPWQVHAI